ncbi:ABC transporter permease [Microbacterium sp. GCS4]|uniref:ABC transporter permease n=1 Tax=Microbacterium sp. GCS4 TaxID=1692239 RepID=UPI00190FC519|nr:ABC transporter permease [Microbacterium sp. GCS4]
MGGCARTRPLPPPSFSRKKASLVALYLLRKFGQTVALLFVVSILVYALLYLAPGSVERTLLQGQPATPETLAAIREQFHLDDPFLAQYWRWVTGAVTGDFGSSIVERQPVTTVIGGRLEISATLAVMAIVLVLLTAIPLGMIAGLRQGKIADVLISGMSVVFLAAPVYATATILLYIFGIALGIFPVFGAGNGFVDRLWHLLLPAITLAIAQFAVVARQMRASVLGVESADYVTFARARGLTNSRILGAYTFRNSMLPVLTVTGLLLAGSLGGVVFIENIFSIPGLGSLLVESIRSKDMPVVQAIAILLATIVFAFNFIVDILYAVVDPRIRMTGGPR